MKIETLDTRTLKTPNDVLKIAVKATSMKPGSILEVLGKGPTFEKDVRAWCEGTGRVILSVETEERDTRIIQIQF